MSFASVEVHVDLEKAFADLGIPIRDRKVVRALYNGYRLAELPAQLGWPARRVDAARFALRADQPSGKALRARLAPYRVSGESSPENTRALTL
ncbi:MAG: hypothetical protein FJW37_02385 [Acidobacteria bacterium]|nr:hypothetical protein [Acidobacteriota bacterium]